MTSRPTPSLSRLLEMVQHFLLAAVSVVVAIVIVVSFTRIIAADSDDPGSGSGVAAAPSATTTTTADTTTTSTTTTTLPPIPASCERDEPAPADGSITLTLYYTCSSRTLPTAETVVYRQVPETNLTLTATLNSLVAGPTDEERRDGFRSAWSDATDGVIDNVGLDAGAATVDFADLDGLGTLTPVEAEFHLADLNATVFGDERVNSVEYRLAGSCDDFWELLGNRSCDIVSRTEFERQMADNRSKG